MKGRVWGVKEYLCKIKPISQAVRLSHDLRENQQNIHNFSLLWLSFTLSQLYNSASTSEPLSSQISCTTTPFRTRYGKFTATVQQNPSRFRLSCSSERYTTSRYTTKWDGTGRFRILQILSFLLFIKCRDLDYTIEWSREIQEQETRRSFLQATVFTSLIFSVQNAKWGSVLFEGGHVVSGRYKLSVVCV